MFLKHAKKALVALTTKSSFHVSNPLWFQLTAYTDVLAFNCPAALLQTQYQYQQAGYPYKIQDNFFSPPASLILDVQETAFVEPPSSRSLTIKTKSTSQSITTTKKTWRKATPALRVALRSANEQDYVDDPSLVAILDSRRKHTLEAKQTQTTWWDSFAYIYLHTSVNLNTQMKMCAHQSVSAYRAAYSSLVEEFTRGQKAANQNQYAEHLLAGYLRVAIEQTSEHFGDCLFLQASANIKLDEAGHIFYRGLLLGSYQGGQGGQALEIEFNARVNQMMAQNVIQSIYFHNSLGLQEQAPRRIRLCLQGARLTNQDLHLCIQHPTDEPLALAQNASVLKSFWRRGQEV
ncbi:hypothetical protein SAMN05421831_11518 [Allopseudospirillum japonicum]|uniref:Uncharacterized protein n=1 Tax=Allopseudospirillum japonicum TaxID=64971 RepID=A0A1H6U6Y8_9GAMM|nr:hypothetical protein [Allopseudospirillum japonicum]SEI88109.1 hypothetical protein SAMN05421831_11518 [Allopseudospirillum japonicum]